MFSKFRKFKDSLVELSTFKAKIFHQIHIFRNECLVFHWVLWLNYRFFTSKMNNKNFWNQSILSPVDYSTRYYFLLCFRKITFVPVDTFSWNFNTIILVLFEAKYNMVFWMSLLWCSVLWTFLYTRISANL